MVSKDKKQNFENYAEVFKVLSNSIRLEILNILKKGETSVSDLISILKLRKANVSQHLTLLRYADLIESRRQGLMIFYKLKQPKILEVIKDLEKIKF